MHQKRFIHIYLLLFSIAIGLVSAVGAICFRGLIEFIQFFLWGSEGSFMERVIAAPWWIKLLVPASAGLLAGFVIVHFVPEARGPGVPEVILSVVNRQSTIRHRVTFLKALVTSLLIGAGASVGREGPIVQIGASVGSSMAQLFRLDTGLRRACLASGAAAGISATFNAPITGTLFAIEVILLDIELSHISHIVVASVTASVLSRIFIGELPTLDSTPFLLKHYGELGFYLILGLSGGLVAILFIRLIDVTDRMFLRLKMPGWCKPGLGGLLLGALAFQVPGALGVGYESVNTALTGSLPLQGAILILFAKMAATALCIGSGMSGGIFAPSLVLGAALGTCLGLAANLIHPGLNLHPAHFALAGMGAVVAGATLAPITAVITIFELTYNEAVILPLMVTCITSVVVVRLLFGYSAYEMKLLRKGVNIVRGHDVGILRNLRVRDFMVREYEHLKADTPLMAVLGRIHASPYPHFIVFDNHQKLAGVISLRDVRGLFAQVEQLKHLLVAEDLMKREVITISAMDSLETALYLFENHRVSFLPVTAAGNPQKILGILKKDDLLRAYRERVLKDRVLSIPVR